VLTALFGIQQWLQGLSEIGGHTIHALRDGHVAIYSSSVGEVQSQTDPNPV
jgi:hypothetical protein